MLKDLFYTIFDNYLTDRRNFDLLTPPRQLVGYSSVTTISKTLPDEIKRVAAIPDSYFIKGTVGVGGLPEITHICIFDREITKSAQEGYYIVFLFDATMSKVYMSLNQGYVQYQKVYGDGEGRRRILKNALIARKYLRTTAGFDFGPIDLKGEGKLCKGYERGNICSKVYEKDDFPDDAIIINDLRNLLGVYRELKSLVGLSILNIVDTITEEAFQEEVQNAEPINEKPGPKPKKPVVNRSGSAVYPRDPRRSSTALRNAAYECENNPMHETFISASSGHAFMEAHHLVPLEFFEHFADSLDTVENIICLCPTCHRAFHYGDRSTREVLIHKFYNQRKGALLINGIDISIEKLSEYYKATAVELPEGQLSNLDGVQQDQLKPKLA